MASNRNNRQAKRKALLKRIEGMNILIKSEDVCTILGTTPNRLRILRKQVSLLFRHFKVGYTIYYMSSDVLLLRKILLADMKAGRKLRYVSLV